MDPQLTGKITLTGWLVLAGYGAYAIAVGIGALALDDDFGEVGKRDRVYQLTELVRPQFVVLALLAAILGLVARWLGRDAGGDSQAALLVTGAKIAAVLAVIVAVGLAVLYATDDRPEVQRWSELARSVSGLPIAAATFFLPQRLDDAIPTSTGPQPATTEQPVTPPPPPPAG